MKKISSIITANEIDNGSTKITKSLWFSGSNLKIKIKKKNETNVTNQTITIKWVNLHRESAPKNNNVWTAKVLSQVKRKWKTRNNC